MMLHQKNSLEGYLKPIKGYHIYVTISIIVAIVWICLPDVNSKPEQACYERLMGHRMNFQTFNKVQFYYFLVGNFILLLFRRKLNFAWFFLMESLILIPVLIKLYI